MKKVLLKIINWFVVEVCIAFLQFWNFVLWIDTCWEPVVNIPQPSNKEFSTKIYSVLVFTQSNKELNN